MRLSPSLSRPAGRGGGGGASGTSIAARRAAPVPPRARAPASVSSWQCAADRVGHTCRGRAVAPRRLAAASTLSALTSEEENDGPGGCPAADWALGAKEEGCGCSSGASSSWPAVRAAAWAAAAGLLTPRAARRGGALAAAGGGDIASAGGGGGGPPVVVLAVVGGPTEASPYRGAPWAEVVAHVGNRLSWSDAAFRLVALTEEAAAAPGALAAAAAAVAPSGGGGQPALLVCFNLQDSSPAAAAVRDAAAAARHAVFFACAPPLAALSRLDGFAPAGPLGWLAALPLGPARRASETLALMQELFQRHTSDDLL